MTEQDQYNEREREHEFQKFEKRLGHRFYMTLIGILAVVATSCCFWIVWASVGHWDQSQSGRFSRCVERACSFVDEDEWETDGNCGEKTTEKRHIKTTAAEAQSCMDRCYELVAGEEEK